MNAKKKHILNTEEAHALFIENNTTDSSFGQKNPISNYNNDLLLFEIKNNIKENIPFKTESYSIILCIKGSYTKTSGPHTFNITPHSIHITRPNQQQVFFDVSTDIHCLVITFLPSFFIDTPISSDIIEQLLLLSPKYPPYFQLDENSFDTMYDLYGRINDEYNLDQFFSRNILINMLIELLYRINRLCIEDPFPLESSLPRGEQLIRQYQELIDKHFRTSKTVKEYADLLTISPKYLSEIVKTETGQTALSMIHFRVIQEARYQLKYTSKTIKEISYLLNFNDITHFSRFFKKNCGITPSLFRKSANSPEIPHK
ncbi:helix-turn-helix domain-containing protein [Flavobacterium sp. '19STA2R22 D10 B1']|uniref:helix-turn-helix domain-containing protein n=1 Tax=Flavobacterium aerium TaxID=3037261 RepID=UPI00278C3463|nr:AraC family transcriptional regulator [Flavobacterium sp. '19STA2R22 D10 B1']